MDFDKAMDIAEDLLAVFRADSESLRTRLGSYSNQDMLDMCREFASARQIAEWSRVGDLDTRRNYSEMCREGDVLLLSACRFAAMRCPGDLETRRKAVELLDLVPFHKDVILAKDYDFDGRWQAYLHILDQGAEKARAGDADEIATAVYSAAGLCVRYGWGEIPGGPIMIGDFFEKMFLTKIFGSAFVHCFGESMQVFHKAFGLPLPVSSEDTARRHGGIGCGLLVMVVVIAAILFLVFLNW